MKWLFAISVFYLQISSVYSVQFVSVNFKGTSFGYEALSPAFAVGFEQGKRRYHWNYSWSNYELSGATSYCDEDALYFTLQAVLDLYDKRSRQVREPTVLFYPGCLFPFAPIGDFARELNWLAVACGPVNEQWMDPARFSSTVLFGAVDTVTAGRALLTLMTFYNWSRLAVILDAQSGDPYALNIRTQQVCFPILEMLRQQMTSFDVIQVDADSNGPDMNLDESLLKAKAHSKIILLCTSVQPFQRFLSVARKLGMAATHVFLFIYELELAEDRFFDLEFFKASRQKTTEQYRNVIVLRTPESPWSKLSDEIHLMRKYLTNDSSVVEDRFSHNDFVMNCYEAAQTTMFVINQTCTESRSVNCGGYLLKENFAGQSFDLLSRRTTFSNSSTKTQYIDIQYLDLTTFAFSVSSCSLVSDNHNMTTITKELCLRQTMFTFDSSDQTLQRMLNSSLLFEPGSAPSDLPVCGIHGELCTPSSSDTWRILVGTLAILVLMGVAVLVSYFRIRQRLHQNDDKWWWLNEALKPVLHSLSFYHLKFLY